mgnify:CR=1 FL=1
MRLGQVSVVLRHAGAFGNKLVRGRETRVGMAFVARGLIPSPQGSVLEKFDYAASAMGGDFDQPTVAVQLQAIMPTEL